MNTENVLYMGRDEINFERKILNISLSISYDIGFGCSKVSLRRFF